MSSSYTYNDTVTFTLTHAKELASRVATDLKRMQRFYGQPSNSDIERYEAELIEYLKAGYLQEVCYGFKRGDNWIEPMLRYTAKDLAGLNTASDDPGKIVPGANIDGASFYSFLVSNGAWSLLTPQQQQNFHDRLPFIRQGAPTPGISGYMVADKTYAAGGKALDRSTLKSF